MTACISCGTLRDPGESAAYLIGRTGEAGARNRHHLVRYRDLDLFMGRVIKCCLDVA